MSTDLPLLVRLERLGDLLRDLDSFARRAEELTGRVDASARRLRGSWTGAAALAHAAAHARWHDAAAEMGTAAEALRRQAATARANYFAALGANDTMWG